MTPEQILPFFTRLKGEFRFARWEKPIVPFIFGAGSVDPDLIKAAFAEVAAISGHPVRFSEDGEGMNLSLWVLDDWNELMHLPGASEFVGMMAMLVKELAEGNQRIRHDITADPKTGAITQMTMIVSRGGKDGFWTAEAMVLRLAALSHLDWAMGRRFPGVLDHKAEGKPALKDIAKAILKAAYDPSVPVSSTEPTLAGQLAALIATRENPNSLGVAT